MKRFFFIPTCVLLLLTASALLNAKDATQRVDEWCSYIDQAADAARENDWASCDQHLSKAYDGWKESMAYFHIVLQHEELNDAEELFAQLHVLSEMQQILIKNIL